jgi:hypothetical protein
MSHQLDTLFDQSVIEINRVHNPKNSVILFQLSFLVYFIEKKNQIY